MATTFLVTFALCALGCGVGRLTQRAWLFDFCALTSVVAYLLLTALLIAGAFA